MTRERGPGRPWYRGVSLKMYGPSDFDTGDVTTLSRDTRLMLATILTAAVLSSMEAT